MSKELKGIAKAWEAKVRKSVCSVKKRGKSVITPMPLESNEEENEPGEICLVEKIFPNGDFYTGQWCDYVPQGQGKYLWTDGCMYVGEWEKGKTNGKGMFSWPSGATYEGEFKTGFMDGTGTYTGSSGDTYKGSWVMNMRHGKGTKSYPNGDFYDGEWKKEVQEGHGRYQWRDGNYYIGQWKRGKFHGNGTMMWTDGNRYDGSWEEGLPKGNGTFKWADGSFYAGVWSKDPKEQSGTYYPAGSTTSGHKDWDPQEVFSMVLNDCQVCPCENVPIYPSGKRLSLFEGDLMQSLSRKVSDACRRTRWVSVDGRRSHSSCRDLPRSSDVDGRLRDGFESMGNLQFDDSAPRASFSSKPPHLILKPVKRQGETISKGHKNYDLMINLQLGIRHSVGRPAPTPSLDLKLSAFDPNEKVWTKFPPEGSKHTPPHPSFEFKWKDYCPVVFRALRKLFKVDPADYMLSICGNDALRELSSPGKSGSFFYLTNDDRYMIKTMKKAEVKVLLRMLPAYYKHFRSFENTLVTKFYGLHCVKLTGSTQKKVRFVIMGNLFCSEYPIHRRFDLKGSTFGRTTDKPEAEIDPTTTLKDLDLNYIFRLQKDWYQDFCTQVDRDLDFLEQERIMDYSMLVGLHFQSCKDSLTPPRTSSFCTPKGDGNIENGGTPRLSVADRDKLLISPSRFVSMQLGINMPARAELTVRKTECETPQLVGERTGKLYDIVIFFGIIDILQDYDISKKLEHAYKAMQYDPTTISAVDPGLYSKRFRDFIFKVFVLDT